MATKEIPPGHVGNLDASQQENLRGFWRTLMQSWDTNIPSSETPSSPKPKSSWRYSFSLSRPPAEEETPAIPSNLQSTLKSQGAGPNELKAIQTLLTKLPGEKLRAAFLTTLKQENPDTLLLRFLRAEKWNVPKAWIKLVTAVDWRVNVYHVDEEVLLKGEEHALQKSRLEGESVEKTNGEGFMVQARTGKGHFHGVDKCGRPIVIIRVRCHDPQGQSTKGLNDFIIHSIETARILFAPPMDSIVSQLFSSHWGSRLIHGVNQTVVFDLTGFTLANWVC